VVTLPGFCLCSLALSGYSTRILSVEPGSEWLQYQDFVSGAWLWVVTVPGFCLCSLALSGYIIRILSM